GTPEIDALEEASSGTPSHQFRKVLWQIANSLKLGSDVGVTLEGIIDDLTVEELNSIKNYAQELGPWTMIYMMASSIVPSLGVTILIVIVSLLNVVIPSIFLMIILLLLLLFQLFFMNFIKSRRPLV
ncbi:type II secretion system F family protein, partial [Candidatus Micrarchaeota archaeon]|nr:type II secretion system F family protein [Candidatus Micrarchaeota archaeon]